MKSKLSFLFLISTTPAFASVSEEICNQLFPVDQIIAPENEEIVKRGAFDLLFFAGKLLFKPASLVDIQKIENNLQSKVKAEGVKLAFLTTEMTHLNEQENEALSTYNVELKDIRKNLKKLGFQKKIRSISSKESCINYIENDKAILEKLQELQNLVEVNFSLITKYEEEKVTYEIEAKENFLIRNNWIIIKEKNLNEIHSLIRKNNPSAVLLLSHSSSNGKLFDHKLNQFPKGFFQSLKGHMDNLIVYSCYSEEVLKQYELLEISKNMNIFYPEAKKRMKQFIGKKTPIIALKSIKNLKLYSTRDTQKKEECLLSFKNRTPLEFGIFLNGVYLSSGSDEIEFDCSLLKETNQIEIYSTVESNFEGKLDIKEVTLNSFYEIPLEEFHTSSTNRHIVTKGTFNK